MNKGSERSRDRGQEEAGKDGEAEEAATIAGSGSIQGQEEVDSAQAGTAVGAALKVNVYFFV